MARWQSRRCMSGSGYATSVPSSGTDTLARSSGAGPAPKTTGAKGKASTVQYSTVPGGQGARWAEARVVVGRDVGCGCACACWAMSRRRHAAVWLASERGIGRQGADAAENAPGTMRDVGHATGRGRTYVRARGLQDPLAAPRPRARGCGCRRRRRPRLARRTLRWRARAWPAGPCWPLLLWSVGAGNLIRGASGPRLLPLAGPGRRKRAGQARARNEVAGRALLLAEPAQLVERRGRLALGVVAIAAAAAANPAG